MHDRHRPVVENWCSASRPFPPAVRHIPGLDDEVRFGFVNVRQDYLTDIYLEGAGARILRAKIGSYVLDKQSGDLGVPWMR